MQISHTRGSLQWELKFRGRLRQALRRQWACFLPKQLRLPIKEAVQHRDLNTNIITRCGSELTDYVGVQTKRWYHIHRWLRGRLQRVLGQTCSDSLPDSAAFSHQPEDKPGGCCGSGVASRTPGFLGSKEMSRACSCAISSCDALPLFFFCDTRTAP